MYGYGYTTLISSMNKTAPLSYLLDSYGGASAAYSLRKLSSTYSGNCIRVRRFSDNVEQNIGFVNNELDTASLLSFAGTSSVLVTTWYDQSGNSRNAVQTSAISQPKIVDVGILNLMNGKPSLKFDSYHMDFMQITSTGGIEIFSVNNYNVITSGSSNAYDINGLVLAYTGGFTNDFAIGSKNSKMAIYSENNNSIALETSVAISTTTPYLVNGYASSSSTGIGFNNSNYVTGSGQRNDLVVRAIAKDSNSVFFYGNASEIIIYPTVKTTDRANINTNINNYYGIY